MKEITQSAVDDIGKVTKFKPTESDFASEFGKRRIKRKYRADGSYEWRMPFKFNDQGIPTADAKKVQGMMREFQVADTERQAKLSGAPGSYGGRGKGRTVARIHKGVLYVEKDGEWVPA